MADPTARFSITASDQTAAAFRSADRNLRSFSRSLSGVRSLLGGFGIVLSGRAFASWIRGSLDATKMTEEQKKATEAARTALAEMRKASDDLAQATATALIPAFVKLTQLLQMVNDLAFDNVSAYDKSLREIMRLTEEQAKLRQDILVGERLHSSESDPIGLRVMKERLIEVNRLLKETNELSNTLRPAELARIAAAAPRRPIDEISVPAQTYRPPPHTDTGGGIDPFMLTPEMREQVLKDDEEFNEERVAAAKRAADRRKQIERDVADEERKLAEERIGFEQQVTTMKQEAALSAAGFLRALGAEHRGAAIAALAIEKALAIKQILVDSHAAAVKAIMIYGPTPAGFAAAKAALTFGRINAAFVAATGLTEALQLSHGGTDATRGTSANPLITNDPSLAPETSAAANRRQGAVQVIIQGPLYGVHDFERAITQALERATNRDVVFIRHTTRQGQELAKGSQ